MTSLNPFELTGRASTHVHEAPLLDARLHDAVIAPAQALREASAAAGIDLVIVSSFRDFTRQAGIWNGKFQGRRPLLDAAGAALEAANLSPAERVRAILIWSALPGASRHHWGTDFDVIDRAALPPGYQVQLTVEEFTGRGPFVRLNEWLGANLGNFGFFRPYTTDRGGVRPEPWHLSYAPVAVPALAALTPEILRDAIEQAELDGKDEILKKLPELYDKYVASVDAP